MRRVEKEILRQFERNGLMDTYNDLKEFDLAELTEIWNEIKWPQTLKARTMCRAVLLMAMKDVLGKERAKKRKSPMTSTTKS